MNKAFFYEQINKNMVLFSAILNFNHENLRSAENTHGQLPCSPMDTYIDLTKLEPNLLKKYLPLQQSDMSEQSYFPYWDFAEETKRLALLDTSTIKALALVFSASVHAKEISQLLDKTILLDLRNFLGKNIYAYILERGQFRLGPIKNIFLEWDKTMPLKEKIKKHGEIAIFSISQSWQQDLQQLFCRKIANDMPDLANLIEKQEKTSSLPPEITQRIWFSMRKLLLKELSSKWLPYFN